MHKLLFAIALLSGSGEAQLIPAKRAATSTFCSKVKSIVTAAKQQSAATAFCASYLHIPSTVVTSTTSVSTNVAKTTVTITSTVTSTTGSLGTTTVTQTATSGTSTVTQSTCPATPVKRAASSTKPSCFSTYTSGAILSSACSCLSIPPVTSTTKVVGTTTSTPTTTTMSTTKVPNTGTNTVTAVTTVPVTTITTNIPPSTCTTASKPTITDGSFEDVPSSDLKKADISSGGWTVHGTQAYFESNTDNAIQAHSGNQFAALLGTSNERETLSQDIPSHQPGLYTLSYYATLAYSPERGSCSFTVFIGDTTVDSFTVDSTTTTSDYRQRSGSYTSDGRAVRLLFAFRCTDVGSEFFGIGVDDVSITDDV